jgi:DNA replication protein DnaC
MSAAADNAYGHSDITYERIKENLVALNMRNTLEIIDNYLEKAIRDKVNVVDVLDHVLSTEAKAKKCRAVENQIQMSGFPFRKTMKMFDFDFQPSIDKSQIDELCTMRFVENKENVVFLGTPGVGKTHLAVALGMIAAGHRYSTYYINCNNLIEQLNKAHYENRLTERLRLFTKYKVLIIDEIGYLPMDIQGANLFFQLIAKRYEKNTTILTSNKMFSQWNEVFSDLTIASAILDRILHHCTVINIKGESYRLKERKEFMKKKDKVVNTLFEESKV